MNGGSGETGISAVFLPWTRSSLAAAIRHFLPLPSELFGKCTTRGEQDAKGSSLRASSHIPRTIPYT